jgi:hypothetical protein
LVGYVSDLFYGDAFLTGGEALVFFVIVRVYVE